MLPTRTTDIIQSGRYPLSYERITVTSLSPARMLMAGGYERGTLEL